MNDTQLAILAKASRRAAIWSAVGLAVIAASLLYFIIQVRRLEGRKAGLQSDITNLQTEIAQLNAKRDLTQSQVNKAVELLNEQSRQNSGPLAQVIQPEARTSPVPGLKASNGLPIYDFILSLDVPEARKKEISEVEYDFNHPSFPKPKQTSTDPSSGYSVSYRGWGCLNVVTITVTTRDDKKIPIYFDECHALGWS